MLDKLKARPHPNTILFTDIGYQRTEAIELKVYLNSRTGYKTQLARILWELMMMMSASLFELTISCRL
jgi:hypothetical protein